ncbi:uncharacterized protein EKO05_0000626 [Ascochyta rabiei]|uniref:Uncharacterized protein n=1 Tax=Didymella rabiei TaxID=5454 RepID=A0A163HLG5_DIDRA|nr:uncharacterized protein EKO05_0000626 [Ascochyta rabiei]KZM25350.1 hypothetical protein ST47_g3548 [Ascochyta rabiei]UPX09949.1 hypothetical protein EKO05_0000626 [Ascochyta rabiei]
MPHHKNLAIHPASFRSSHLSIPPSPFSPRSPLTPVPRPKKHGHATGINTTAISTQPPAPNSPLQWVWTCHACTRAYPLGATRRCLDDGHHFCAGTTTAKSWRKDGSRKQVRRRRACSSEFDYLGWKDWGRWRRSQPARRSVGRPIQPLILDTGDEKEKNCWRNCDFPSQCRWGKQAGIHTPTPTRVEFPASAPSSETWACSAPMTDMPTLADCFAAEDNASNAEHRTGTGTDADADADAGALGRLLRISFKQRKRSGLTPSSPVCISTADEAVDIEMCAIDTTAPIPEPHGSCIDPSLLVLPDPAYTSTSTSTSTYTSTSTSTYTYTSTPTPTYTYTYTYTCTPSPTNTSLAPSTRSTAPPSPSPTAAKPSTTIQRSRARFSSGRTASPRQTVFPPVADWQRRAKDCGAGAPVRVVTREPRFESEVVVDEGSALERVGRWTERVVNVG